MSQKLAEEELEEKQAQNQAAVAGLSTDEAHTISILATKGVVWVRLVDDENKPYANCAATLLQEDNAIAEGKTDGAGEVCWEGLRQTHYAVRFTVAPAAEEADGEPNVLTTGVPWLKDKSAVHLQYVRRPAKDIPSYSGNIPQFKKWPEAPRSLFGAGESAQQPTMAEKVADEMMRLEGQQLGNSQGGGPIGNTGFSRWVLAAAEQPALPASQQTTMCCFEAVLFAAHRVGAISWQQLHDLFSKAYAGKDYPKEELTSEEWDAILKWGEELPGFMQAKDVQKWQPGAQLPKGAVVMFDGASHVALATGNGSEVMSFNAGGAIADGMVVERTTVEALKRTAEVTYGMPPW